VNITNSEEKVMNEMLDVMDRVESAPIASKELDVPEKRYDFDEDFQRKIVALFIRDDKFLKRCSDIIKPDYLDSLADKLLISIAISHFDNYGLSLNTGALAKVAIRDAITKRIIRKDEQSKVIDRLKELFKEPLDNSEFVIDQCSRFAKRQAIENAFIKSINNMDGDKFNPDAIEEDMKAAFSVGARTHEEPYDYYKAFAQRTEVREKIASGEIKRRGLPIGVPEFDSLLHHRGFGLKELTILMAGAKRGKTTALWDIAKRWSLMGYRVLGITLEVSKEVISDRLDANISGVPMSKLEDELHKVHNKLKDKLEKGQGNLMMHEFGANSYRPKDLEMLLEDYKAKGIVFDAIVIDYLDIMAPNKWTQDERVNSKNVWLDSRAIAAKYDVAMLSATQTNREGATKTVADDTDVADDFNKIRIADLVISINATEDEIKRGESRLYLAASRNQRGKFSVLIQNNMECMQFMTKVLDIG